VAVAFVVVAAVFARVMFVPRSLRFRQGDQPTAERTSEALPPPYQPHEKTVDGLLILPDSARRRVAVARLQEALRVRSVVETELGSRVPPVKWKTHPAAQRKGMLDRRGFLLASRDVLPNVTLRVQIPNEFSANCLNATGSVDSAVPVRQCSASPGWLSLPTLPMLGLEEIRTCLRNKHIVFAGNSITRYIAWALVDLASNFGLRQTHEVKLPRNLWGSHAEFFVKASTSAEATLANGVRMYSRKVAPHRDNSVWQIPSLNLNVTFGYVLREWNDGSFSAKGWTEKSIIDFGTTPDLAIISQGLAMTMKPEAVKTHQADVKSWMVD
jgi:hypothetical protein